LVYESTENATLSDRIFAFDYAKLNNIVSLWRGKAG